MAIVERQLMYVIKVKLPEVNMQTLSRCLKHPENCRKAIFKEKPEGFEVDWDSAHTWPIDAEGYTWIKLYCTDPKMAIEFWMRKSENYRKQLLAIKEVTDNISIEV
jgi:hypothetical protein